MSEAIKIVKAKLNEALNKNDAQAVREACLVLKAMEEESIHPADADVRIVNADTEYFVCNNPKDGNARSVIKSVNKMLNEVKKDLQHAKDANYDVDIKAGLDKFTADIQSYIDNAKGDITSSASKKVNNLSVTAGERSGRMDGVWKLITTNDPRAERCLESVGRLQHVPFDKDFSIRLMFISRNQGSFQTPKIGPNKLLQDIGDNLYQCDTADGKFFYVFEKVGE